MSQRESKMQSAFHELQTRFFEEPYPSVDKRRQWLTALERMLLERASEIATAIDEDFGGRDADHTRVVDILPSLLAIRHARRRVHRWMQPQRRPVSWLFWPGKAMVLPQPLGVVGIVVPWNYPVFLSIGPLVGALAAGNRAMIKMSEKTPAFSRWLATTLPEYVSDDVVRVVTGDATVAEAFTHLPFGHLLFTGSADIGRKVMAAAAKTLTPVTLELGGKSPVLIDQSANLQRAARRILAAKWTNAGQTCVAPDYVLVAGQRGKRLVEALREAASAMRLDNSDTPHTNLLSESDRKRLQAWLDEAQASGAHVCPLAATPSSEVSVAPVAVLAPHENTELMRKEIFGPVLPVLEVPDWSAAMRWVQERPKPLAIYLFSEDRKHVMSALTKLQAGGVTVNDCMLHVVQEELPFGGVGESGMGHYHGYAGFVTFSKMKGVFEQSRWSGTDLLAPPYTPWKRRLIRWLMRWGR